MDYYAGKRVLVTGHTGFKGSWLSFILSQIGAEVFGLSLSDPVDSKHSFFALGVNEVVKNPESAYGDICKININKLLSDVKPHYIFHLAAQAIVSESYFRPVETILTNSMGSIYLADAIRTSDLKVTSLFITSDKCYKNLEQESAYIETDELGGNDPYSSSKASAEILLNSYFKSFPSMLDNGIATARAGNVFGGGDWSQNRLIPDCARQIYDGNPISIRMPHATRPWSYVLDILEGYLLLASKLSDEPIKYHGSYNFASGETHSVEDVVEAFLKITGAGAVHVEAGASFGHESKLLQIDATKSRLKLGWSPKLSVHDSLKESAKWYLAQSEETDMRNFSKDILVNRKIL